MQVKDITKNKKFIKKINKLRNKYRNSKTNLNNSNTFKDSKGQFQNIYHSDKAKVDLAKKERYDAVFKEQLNKIDLKKKLPF